MNEQNEDKKALKKQEEQNATKDALKTGAKAAATYLAPGVGGKVVDAASKIPALDKALNKGAEIVNKVPGVGKVTNAAKKSGALDAADKAIDVSGGNAAGASGNALQKTPGLNNAIAGGSKDGLPSTDNLIAQTNNNKDSASKNNSSSLGNFNKSNNSSSDDNNQSGNNENEAQNKSNNKKKLIIGIGTTLISFFLIIIIILVILLTIMYPVEMTMQYIKRIWNNIVNFFTNSAQEVQEKYYEELASTQTDINKNYNICIDVNLITATLLVKENFEDTIIEGEQPIDEEDISYSDSSDESNTKKLYKKMTKQVRLLANMQYKTKKYGLDNTLKEDTGYYCNATASIKPVTPETIDSYHKVGFNTDTILDSSTPKVVASNDKEGLLTKRVNEEVNYEYNIYQPPFDSEGNCTDSYAKDMLPKTKREVSIGTYTTRTESVYYWNLINYFIPTYYEEYLPSKDDPNYENTVIKIADDIYLLYEQYGPSQTCASSYQGPSSLCPSGITIEGEGTVDFEEYIAGVVSKEAYSSEGIEALKAQAVAARTYALKVTNYCQNTISNSTKNQTYTKNINDAAREATNATAGEILIDSNGNIFSSQYDSFCYDDPDCPDARVNEDGTYSVTYTKVPTGEQHTITLSDKTQYDRILPGKGHAHGMSQLVSYQLAKEGKTYREILSYFYSDGVTISLVLSPTTTSGATIIDKPLTKYLEADNLTIIDMNNTIYNQVRKAGVGTRDGVVAAGVTLINNFYSQTGHILPYELYPSGKYKGYGMDPSWGTTTGRSDYPVNGLDCSGFISWAMHNGGYKYEVLSAQGWGNAGVKRNWSKGTYDSSAKPGDLIFNAPQSANGTTGHIRMIVDVTAEGYVVAEASGKKNGVRITTIAFTSTGPYYLVNMDNYYANKEVVSDYPG